MPNHATTPQRVTTAIEKFCTELSPDFNPVYVRVAPTEDGRPGRCYANVERYIAEHGGTFQHGWIIWEEPGIYLAAEHHCVHVQHGRYLDVTPPMFGERRILFLPTRPSGVPDVEQLADVTVNGTIGNHYFPLASPSSENIVSLLRYREDAPMRNGEWQHLDRKIDHLITDSKTRCNQALASDRRKQLRQRKKRERARKKKCRKRR